MSRRKVPTCMSEVRKSRSCFSGAVTKVLEKLQHIKHDEVAAVAAINPKEVERLLGSLSRTEKSFEVTLDEAQEYAPEGEEENDKFQEDEEDVRDVFEGSLAVCRELAELLLALKNVQVGLADLAHDVATLKESLTERPDNDHSQRLSSINEAFHALRQEWRKGCLPSEHALKKELDACTKAIDTLAEDTAKAKVRSSPVITSSSHPVSSRVDRDRTKLPAISIPTFNGDILAWPTFWQKFSATVHVHDDLPDSTKLAYLRTAITDPEAAILLNPAIDGPDTYERLVKELHQRYARTRKIHRGLVHKLSTLPSAKYQSKDLRKLLDSATSFVNCLKTTKQFTLEAVITSMVYGRLPYKLQVEWDDDRDDDDKVAPYTELFDYMAKKILILSDNQTSTPSEAKPPPKQEKRPKQQPSRQKAQVYSVSSPTQHKWECPLCKPDRHPLYTCPKWLGYTVAQRMAHIKQRHLCTNCLGVGHPVATCKSTYRCRECGQAHHSSIHQEEQPSQQVTSTLSQSQQLPDALLQTAEVLLKGPEGQEVRARALIDSAAGLSLITHRMAKLLELPMHKSKTALTTLQDSKSLGSEHLTEVTICPTHRQLDIKCRPAVLKNVISTTPSRPFAPVDEFPHLWGLRLADPSYNIPGHVDILLGSDVWLKLQGNLPPITEKDSPVGAVNTIFGWVVTGTAPVGEQQQQMPVYHLQPTISNEELHKLAYNFWLSEAAEESAPSQSQVEAQVENHYSEHVRHNPPADRYEVELPRIPNSPELGESKSQAVQRYHSHERTCRAKGQEQQFHDQIKGYLEAGHAEKVPEEEISLPSFYLPMHSVSKSQSTTTKMRVVFDGSATTSTGVSLNQILQVGPTIQPTLTRTLIKFRDYPIALTADVSKMYREVGLAVKDRNLHRFVWRPTREEQLRDYRMTRVTFGVSCSPYLAIRTLQQTARDHGQEHPQAARHIIESFYVDDLLAGATTEEEAIRLVPEMRAILKQGGFNLCKWRSSSQTVLKTIPAELQETMLVKEVTTLQPSAYPKALGLRWDSKQDQMSPSINVNSHYQQTKRGIISDVSKTFDVLGWIAPSILPMKILYQKLWEKGQEWDGRAPVDVIKEHADWREELPCLAEKSIPRCYSPLDRAKIIKKELHGFCDASLKAFGAVVYVRTVYLHQPPTVTLVTAKTKVTKTKPPTIPKLELCGAVLLTKLLNTVSDVLNIPLSNITAWTDSSIVVAWLDGHSRTMTQYVYNRVYYVLDHTNPQNWKHVPGVDNPADCASRGMAPRALLQHSLWWEGPAWLYQEPVLVPDQPPRKTPPDLNSKAVHLTLVHDDFSLKFEERTNDYYRIIITVAWWFRLFHRLKGDRPPDRRRQLTPRELEEAEKWLLRKAQQRHFSKELRALRAGEGIAPTSRLRTLTPMLGTDGLLRIGGRLSKSSLSKYQQHPIIVDSKSTLVEKMFAHKHISLGHCGPSLLLCHTGHKFHVLGGRRLSRSICRNCVICKRVAPQPVPQQMGELPRARSRAGQPPFTDTGMDFAGPFSIKLGHTRRPVIVNAYLCIFVCMATKAVHLEVTSDLKTDTFIACFRRFAARRNCPKTIRCDNGPNFTGAKNELHKLYQFLQDENNDDVISQALLRERIEWISSPAEAPHFGGLWESAVKSMKRQLRRVMGTLIVTFEELVTITCQIEACLNSRPLLPITSHNTDGLATLTAGHFLFLDQPRSYPEDPRMPEEPRLLKRWQQCQSVVQHLWARWTREYLHMLQARTKWQHVRPNLRVNDIVILKEDRVFACHWPLARILEVHPGEDGLVRVATIQPATGRPKKRPVTKLALLHRPEENNQTVPSPSASPGRMFGQKESLPTQAEPQAVARAPLPETEQDNA